MAGGTKQPGPVGIYIATRFLTLYKQQGPALRKIGELMGASHAHVGALLHGRNSMRIEDVLFFCQLYDIDPADLIREALKAVPLEPLGTTETDTTELDGDDDIEPTKPTDDNDENEDEDEEEEPKAKADGTTDGYTLAAHPFEDFTREAEGAYDTP